MKLPSGTPLIRNEPVKNGDVTSILSRIPTPFNGYLAVTGIGYDGVEEGILLVENSTVTHAYYVHLKYLHEERGKAALPLVLNTFLAEGANVDVVEFTIPKLKLTASFNEDAKIDKPFSLSELQKMIPEEYSKDHVVRIIKLRPADELDGIKSLISIGLGFGRLEDLG